MSDPTGQSRRPWRRIGMRRRPVRPVHLPWLPPAQVVLLPERGETFVRVHRHADPTAPTLLLLHGWTASADLQFFTAYEHLAEQYSFVAIDHRGHGRGLRSSEPFHLEDAADDAAALSRVLGLGPVVVIGYSMGGPVGLHLTRRHPGLVAGLVVQATALEWRATRRERIQWQGLRVMGPVLRSWWLPHWMHLGMERLFGPSHPLHAYTGWMEAETRRSDDRAIVHAGRALSRYDARDWAANLDVPAAMLITTRDRLVPPAKQRALAEALRAEVREHPSDHLMPWSDPEAFATITRELVDAVMAQLSPDAVRGRRDADGGVPPTR